MNPKSNFDDARSRPSKPTRRINFKLATVMVTGCVLVATGLLLPFIKYEKVNYHRMPPGQFQADMRTMVAAVHYLLTPETDGGKNPVHVMGGMGPITQRTKVHQPDMSEWSADQTGTNVASATNSPVPLQPGIPG